MKMRASHHSIHLSAFHLKDCINQVASRLRKKSTVPIWGHQHQKTEHSLALYTPSRRLRYERQIKPLDLFHLLLLEMWHGDRKM